MAMKSLLVVLCLSAVAAEPARPEKAPESAKPASQAYAPTSAYAVKDVEGWKVYVHKDLLGDKKALGDEAVKLLGVHLYEITRRVPGGALAKLRRVPIWVEENPRVTCACYHPSRRWLEGHGFNPEKAKSVEIGGPRNFINWTKHQFNMVLHELAHGYHHRELEGGYGNAEIKAAYDRMVESKKYESVLLFSGKKERHYALSNPMEYFAESSEAYFGTNDFYPFVRAELKGFDPEMYRLLVKLWGK